MVTIAVNPEAGASDFVPRVPEPGHSGGRARPGWPSRLLALVGAGAILQPLGALVARVDWRLDLLTHFAEPACWLAAVCLAVALWRRKLWLALAWGALVSYQAIPLYYFWGANPVAPDPRSAERLRIVVANVLWDNFQHDRLLTFLDAEEPDIVGLLEFSPLWLPAAEQIQRDYPYSVVAPKWDNGFGFAIFSKRPLLSARGPEQPTPLGWPYLVAQIDFDGQPLDFFLIHPSNPLRRPDRSPGHPEIEVIAWDVARASPTRVVAGDFNTTEGSPYFRDLAARTGLRDSRLGFGRQSSWPTFSPFRIPIDHALVSADLAVVDRHLGPNIGSDHFPLVLELAPAASRSARSANSTRPASSDSVAVGSN